jgi:iron complex outermembrane recepter protein
MYTARVRARAFAISVVTLVVALFPFSTSVLARAADLEALHKFNIPAQSLDTALLAFSDQAKVQVLMWSDVRTNPHSQGATGDRSAASALAAILESTGLSFQQIDAETVAIVKSDKSNKAVTEYDTQGAAPKQRLAQADNQTVAAVPVEGGGGQAAANDADEAATVTVTGTRIVRNGYSTPTPVTVVGTEQIQDSGKPNIADVLNEMPAFQGSLTPASSGVSNQGTAGGNNLNLRNLGANRTLVLFDGRRYPPEFATNVVDINLIPDALVERVDVVTGGASAVYGSDALAGVVNFVLNTNFTGLKASVQGGISGEGDGANDKVSLAWGTKFADGRGHFIFSADQEYQAEINDRAWNEQGYSLIQNPAYTTTNGQPQLITRTHVGLTAGNPGGIITGGPLQGTAFGPGGAPFQWNYGNTVTGQYQVGGDWATSSMMGAQSIMPSNDSTHIFTHLAFDVTDDTQVFAEFNNGNVHTDARCCYPYYLGNLTVHPDNPYMPASVAQQAQALGLTNIPYGITLRDPSQGFGTIIDRWNDVYVVGAKGKFNFAKTDWTWNAYLQRGVSTQNFWVPYQPLTANFMQAIDAVRGPNGSIVCRSTLTNPNNGCVPYNIFGTGVVTQSMLDYSEGGPAERQTLGQNLAGASVTGEPFSTWAGPVSVAGDLEYRKDTIAGTNDIYSANRGWFSTQLTGFDASQHVEEGALETVIPLLKDVPFGKALDFNGAARATEYSTSGYVTTWKAGLTFQPIDDVRFRLTQSRDIRAPNLNDLYASPQTNHNTIPDPFHGNVSYPYYQVTLGNPDLKPEKATETGIGVVFQPLELPGFNASIDYYRIDTKGVITTPTYAYALEECYGGVQSYCSDITRSPNGTLNSITVQPLNQAELLAKGIDFEASYLKRLPVGALGVRLVANETLKLVTDSGIPGAAEVLDAAGTGVSPRWSVNANITYDIDRWRVSWTSRYYSSEEISDALIQCSTNCPNLGGFQTVDKNYVPSYFVSNMSLTFRFLERDAANAEAFLAIDNVFDKQPPLYPSQIAGASYAITTDAVLYDTVGRAFRAGIRLKM